jgi:TrmH family RNA methyltransferase
MLSKNAVKYYSTLLQKKYRDRERKFIVEGKRLIEEAIDSSFECETIICTENFVKNNKEFFLQIEKGFRVEIVKEIDFKRLSDTQTPQGILGVFSKGNFSFIFEPKTDLVLAMENISDPGNVGTIFRNADWFGIKQIILSKECAEVFNPKVLRASMGSVFHIEFFDTVELNDELKRLKENKYTIAVADMNGDNIYNYTRPQKLVITVCNEAHGPSQKLLELADVKLTIPRKGKAESLNVASASAVILSELTK